MLDRSTAEWLLHTYAWILRAPGAQLPTSRPLVTPTDEFFPDIPSGAPDLPARLLRALQLATDTASWRCGLMEQESCEAQVIQDGAPIIPAEWEPAGTFRRSFTGLRPPELRYHPMLVARPAALVALLAHGLSHIMLSRCPEPPPGDEAAWDHAADLGAVFLGAGIFLANAAHEVVYEEGVHWEGPAVYCQGWLAEHELAFALAVFARVHGHAIEAVERHLRPSPRCYVRKAARALQRDRLLRDSWLAAGLPVCAAA